MIQNVPELLKSCCLNFKMYTYYLHGKACVKSQGNLAIRVATENNRLTTIVRQRCELTCMVKRTR